MPKKKKAYPPGYVPPDAVAWCALHERGMNYRYIRKKRCLFKRCKHLQWYPSTPPTERSQTE